MTRSLLTILSLAVLATACSGPIFGGRNDSEETPNSQRERLPPIEELLALNIESIPMTAEGAQSLRQLSTAIERGREVDRPALRSHRGQLLVDFAIAADAWSLVDPARGEWYAAAAGVLVGVDSTAPEFGARVYVTVRGDLGEASVDTIGLVECAVGGQPTPAASSDARLAVVKLTDMSQAFAGWRRYGDAGDVGSFSTAAVGESVPAESELDSRSLQSEANSRQVAVLRSTLESCAAVESLDTPLSRAVAGVSDDLRRRVSAAAVPLQLDSGFIDSDPQLVPPRSFYSMTDGDGGLGFTFRRIMVIRATGVLGLLQPHVGLRDGQLYFPGEGEGWLLPGRTIIDFDGPGAIPPSAIEADSAPAVEAAFGELEAVLEGADWVPIEERRGVGVSVGVSVIADGDTYYSTMRPLLRALWNQEYGPIALHTLNSETQQLDAVAVRLVEGVAALDNVVVVREDGYLVKGYDPENLRTPTTVSRIAPGALLTLHNAIVEGFESGVLDPDQPLTVQVDDNSIDYGVLAHMLAAISFARDRENVSTDLELLRSPIVFDEDIPDVLAPRGLRLAL